MYRILHRETHGTEVICPLQILQMKPQANVAEATAGEVAAVDGSAATPAEADNASTSHPLPTPTHSHSSSVFAIFFINHKTMVAISVQKEKKFHVVYSNRI